MILVSLKFTAKIRQMNNSYSFLYSREGRMSSSSESGINVTAQNKAPFNQGWFQDAYKSAVEFYEKDSALDSRDRLEISKAYVSLVRAQMWGGWLGFATIFGSPFAYRYYKTSSIRGVKVPRNFVLGLIGLVIGQRIAGDRTYKSRLRELDPNGEFHSAGAYGDAQSGAKSGQQRQYEMLKLLGPGMAPRWATYFYSAYTNPERRLPDPKRKLKEMEDGKLIKGSPFLNQRDPLGLYSGPRFDKKKGVPQVGNTPQPSSMSCKDQDGDIFGEADQESSSRPALSSWDRIRQENNVETSSSSPTWSKIAAQKSAGHDKAEHFSDDRIPEDDSQREFDELLERERRGEDEIH